MLQIINKFNVISILQLVVSLVKTERRIVGGNEAKPRKDNSLTFPACFYIPIIFSNLNSNCSNLLYLRNLQEQVKNHSATKNCSDLSLFEQIVLVISKFLQILNLQP